MEFDHERGKTDCFICGMTYDNNYISKNFHDLHYAVFFLEKGCPNCYELPKKIIQSRLI